jgi:hypothetical protein
MTDKLLAVDDVTGQQKQITQAQAQAAVGVTGVSRLPTGAPIAGTPILDLISTAPVAARHPFYQLRAGYSGGPLTLRRGSDDDELLLSFADGVLDIEQMLDFLGGGIIDGFCKTLHDQQNAYDLTQLTNALQPKLWDGASKRWASALHDSVWPASERIPALVIPAGGSLERADNSGLGTGNPAITLAIVASTQAGAGLWRIGGAAGQTFFFLFNPSNNSYLTGTTTGARDFPASDPRKMHRILFSRAAGADANTSALRQDAVDLSLGASVSGTPALTDTQTLLYGNGTAIACDIEWNVDLPTVSAADAAKVEQWMRAAHETPF